MKRTSLLHVKCKDHIEHRNLNPAILARSIREVVGWLVKEIEDAIFLSADRTVLAPYFEKPCRESGFIILKKNILERWEIG